MTYESMIRVTIQALCGQDVIVACRSNQEVLESAEQYISWLNFKLNDGQCWIPRASENSYERTFNLYDTRYNKEKRGSVTFVNLRELFGLESRSMRTTCDERGAQRR